LLIQNRAQHLIYNRTKHLLQVRRNLPAFAPLASQRVLARHSSLLILLRGALENPVLVVINLSSKPVSLELSSNEAGLPESKIWVDQITQNKYFMPPDQINLNLSPYQVVWLTPAD
jgi:hypothetical protein